MKKVFVVIPIFNRLAYTKQCLRSIKSLHFRNITTIVVDDGSTDGSESYIKKYYPETLLIKGNGHWWWSKSMNEGIKVALKNAKNGDFVLSLNNDCYFGPTYLNQLLNTAMEYPDSIIASICVLANQPSKVVEAGIRIDWPSGIVYGVAPVISDKLSYFQKMKVVDKLDALPGKGTLIPIKVFKKIGLFNQWRLPHYIADYEFSNRAKRTGFDLLVDTHALVKHHWHATGDYFEDNKTVGYKKAIRLMFGRKSMNNVIDWINFLILACPKRYWPINLWILHRRIRNHLLNLYPFYYARPFLMRIGKYYRAIRNYPELNIKH